MVTQRRVGSLVKSLPCRTCCAARKWPMLVMHEPMKTSSTPVSATSDRSRASSGSLGAQRMGSVIASRLMSIISWYSAFGSACRRRL